MFAAGLVIAASAAVQALAAHALGSAWWVPQLAIVALLRRTSLRPGAWLPLSVIGAAALIALSIRWAGAVLLLVVGLGAVWRAAMWYWDVVDVRLQAAAAGAGAALLIGVTAALDQAFSWPMAGLICWQAGLTAAAALAWAAARPAQAL